MPSTQGNLDKVPFGNELRRSQRVLLSVPVSVAWSARGGDRVEEQALTEVVNAHGALLRMSAPLAVGTEVELTHGHTKKSTRGVVVYTEEPTKGRRTGIGLELEVPSDIFWGVSIPPQRSTR